MIWVRRITIQGLRNNKKLRSTLLLVSVLTSTLLFFQNCGDPSLGQSSAQSSYISGLSFAYETKVDTVAYMSCSGIQEDYNKDAYFSFKVGAYATGSGLKLSDSYRNEVKNFSDDRKAEALAESQANAGLALQLAVRQASNLQGVMTGNSGSFEEDSDFDDFFDASLDSQKIAEALVLNGGDYINYFSGIEGLDNRLMEAGIRFFDSEVQAQSVRNQLRDDGLLALTYAYRDTTDLVAAKGDSGFATDSAYGTGFEISFGIGLGMGLGDGTFYQFTNADRRVMRTLTEKNLQTGSSTGNTWQCRQSASFLIVRPEDNASVGCSTTAEDPNNPDPDYQAIRRVLPLSHWHVDLVNRCVVPKASVDKCYGTDFDSSTYTIDYNGGQCNHDSSGLLCPHYISVCTLM